MHQWLSRILAVLLLVPGLGMVALGDASAGQCRTVRVPVWDSFGGALTYKVTQVDCGVGDTPGAKPGGNGGGKGAPGCDLAGVSPATFCLGPFPCFYIEAMAPIAPPATPPPAPGAKWHVRMCLTPGQLLHKSTQPIFSWEFTAEWVGQAPQPPPLIDRARAAFGELVVPSATLAFNPTSRTLVHLDTWFWAQGLTGQELQGTPAFGLVAVATPQQLQVDPGDGSAPFTCQWVTSRSGTCKYPYRRSSVGGSVRGLDGAPAYQAIGTTTWGVRFEQDGKPVAIPGAPTELTGPELTSAVQVGEVQTVVTWAR